MHQATHPSPAPDRIEAQLQDLARLRALAMAIAEATAAQTLRQLAHTAEAATAALPPAPETPLIDPDRAFPRIARCVRLTIALEEHISRSRTARPPLSKPEQDRLDRRREQTHAKADAIVKTEAKPDEMVALFHRVRCRLDEREIEHLLDDTPVDQIALKICKELGLPCDPAIWTPWLRRQFSDTALTVHDIPLPPAPPQPAPAFHPRE